MFEEFRRGTADELAAELARREAARRVHDRDRAAAADARRATPRPRAHDDDVDALLRALLDQGVPASTVAQALTAMPGVGRNQAYARVLALGARDAGAR